MSPFYLYLVPDEAVTIVEHRAPTGEDVFDLVLVGGREGAVVAENLTTIDLLGASAAIRDRWLAALPTCVVDAGMSDGSCTIWNRQTGSLVRLKRLAATNLASHVMVALGDRAELMIDAEFFDTTEHAQSRATFVVGQLIWYAPTDGVLFAGIVQATPESGSAFYKLRMGPAYACWKGGYERTGALVPAESLRARSTPCDDDPDTVPCAECGVLLDSISFIDGVTVICPNCCHCYRVPYGV